MKKILSIVLAIVMVLSMVTPVFASKFEDIDDCDYKVAIERLTALEVINGKTATEYDPDGIVTRAEMAKLLVVCLGLKTGATILENTVTFSDTQGHWAIGYINVAAQYGLIKGDGDGKFRPDDTVNYAEAVTMAIRALNYQRVVDKQGEWPTNYLNKAFEMKLFDDVDFSNAKDGANRGSIAQIIWNMLNNRMWVVTSENEKEGIYYGKDTENTMLELKFPDYTVKEELVFKDWSYDVEKGEYVVKVKLGTDIYEYEGDDFYKYVPETEVEALIYKDEKVISMYPTDDNYLAEGSSKTLEDKYDKFGGTAIYAYLLLNSSKRSATILGQVDALGNEIVKEVEHKDSTKYTTVKTDLKIYRIDDEEGVEATDNALLLKDGSRTDISKLNENDVITWFENDAGEDVIGIVSTDTIKGQFNSIKMESKKLEAGTTISVKISGKEYEMNIGSSPYFVELDKNEKEVNVDFNKLLVKEKDNDYVGEDLIAYLDAYGNIYKVAFGYVSGVVKNVGLYLVVDGNIREVSSKTDSSYYITLANKDGEDGYAISDEATFPAPYAGAMYWVEFNSDDEILDMILVDDGVAYKDYDVDYVNEEFNDKTSYFGDKKVTSTTVIYTIVEKLKDDDSSYTPKKYELKVSNGSKALDGIEEGLVAYEDDSVKASFIVVEGESKSTDKLVGVLNDVSLESEVISVEISGNKYEVKLPTGLSVNAAYNKLRALKGAVVAYTLDDDKATIQFAYTFDELDRAGRVTKVTKEGTIFVYDPDSHSENEYDLDLFNIEAKDGGLGFEDHTVVVITIAYKNGQPYFESAEIVDGIDNVTFAEDDLIAVHTEEKLNYFAVIQGLDLDS